MIRYTVKTNFNNVPAFRAKVGIALDKGVAAAALELKGEIQRGFGKGARLTASAPGTPQNVQRGQLRASIRAIPQANHTALVGSFGLPYGRIHEFGGTIVAGGKMLKVPVNASAKRASELGDNLPAVVIKRPGKPPILMGTDGSRRASRTFGFTRSDLPVWILTPVVRIPPRPYIRPAALRARPAMLKAFNVASTAAMQQAFVGAKR